MSVPISSERRRLTAAEFEMVEQTHHPRICALSDDERTAVMRRIREFRDKARTIANQQRREMRRKAEPRGDREAADNSGTALKVQIFTSALKRLNRESRRMEEAARRPTQSAVARNALELKRANRRRHHPDGRQTPSQGMRAITNSQRTVDTDPREIGRVSQFVKASQARRDAR
ncbi:hypothetical protein [Azospirillum sp. B21]|uniref:hypothetical protein n=1 Tax=Azospirillum sp. B21 TaxID=2607496 RepID=UPI0011EC0E8F|nr:hypothetical protein [Azospirillum sp. B21]